MLFLFTVTFYMAQAAIESNIIPRVSETGKYHERTEGWAEGKIGRGNPKKYKFRHPNKAFVINYLYTKYSEIFIIMTKKMLVNYVMFEKK